MRKLSLGLYQKQEGISSEAITRVSEAIEPQLWKSKPVRISLPDAPAPSSKVLEDIYYPKPKMVTDAAKEMLTKK